MATQKFEQHRAFGLTQSHYVRREQRIDIDNLLPALRVRTDKWVGHWRIGGNRRGKPLLATGLSETFREAVAEVMDRFELIEHPPDRR